MMKAMSATSRTIGNGEADLVAVAVAGVVDGAVDFVADSLDSSFSFKESILDFSSDSSCCCCCIADLASAPVAAADLWVREPLVAGPRLLPVETGSEADASDEAGCWSCFLTYLTLIFLDTDWSLNSASSLGHTSLTEFSPKSYGDGRATIRNLWLQT